MEVLEGEDDGYWRHQQLRSRGNTIEAGPPRSCATSSPSACSAFRVALMQFAFTEEQELLRREAREALGNGGWSREDIAAAELGFVDQAILYEEAGRATSASRLRRDPARDERLTALALGGRHLAEGARPRRRVREGPEQFGRKIGVYQAVSHALADTYVETELARSLAYWAAWSVAEDDEQAPIAAAAAKAYASDAAVVACERSIQVHAASASPGSTCCTSTTSARSGSRRTTATRASSGPGSPPGCSIERPDGAGHRRFLGNRRGLCRPARALGLAGARGRAPAGDAPEGTEEVVLDVTDAAHIQAAAEGVDELHALVNNAGIAIAMPLEFVPLDELRHQLEVNLVGQVAVTQAFLPALRRARGRIVFVGSIAGKSAALPRALRRRRSTRSRRSPTLCGSSSGPGGSASRSSSRARSRPRSGRAARPRPTSCSGPIPARPSCTASASRLSARGRQAWRHPAESGRGRRARADLRAAPRAYLVGKTRGSGRASSASRPGRATGSTSGSCYATRRDATIPTGRPTRRNECRA